MRKSNEYQAVETAEVSLMAIPAEAAAAGADALTKIAGSVMASRDQKKAQKREMAFQREMFDRQVALQEPWRQAGIGALSDMRSLLADPSRIQDSAAYQFRMDEGNRALERNLAARGGTLGGGALRELTRYGQGMASDEFSNQFNRLASLAGIGQSATNATSNAMTNYTGAGAAGITGMGNIRASSYQGAANAISGGIGDYMNYNLMRDIYGSSDSGGGYSGGMKAPRADTGY